MSRSDPPLPPLIRDPRLSAERGVKHGFFTREGGTSGGIYASLNAGPGSGDSPDRVAANRARAAAGLGLDPARLVTAHQVHSADVVRVDGPWETDDAPRADGLVTALPGLGLGVLAADCAPVLLADGAGGVIGAAHAGWRGALAGIIDATVAAMEDLGARRSRIAAAIGPCIGQASYEVGPEFPAPFLAETPENDVFFRAAPRDGHYLFDLGGFVAARLAGAGLGPVAPPGFDTCAQERRFFSYRRSILRGEPDYGRNLSLIALAE
ncbi:MAG: peptidoglycan editing factor PgeF [Alphaproteobacteria bacterium]|nr:peptidoglycan editing factor PgeF [Alphaproteobacteria bacterium]